MKTYTASGYAQSRIDDIPTPLVVVVAPEVEALIQGREQSVCMVGIRGRTLFGLLPPVLEIAVADVRFEVVLLRCPAGFLDEIARHGVAFATDLGGGYQRRLEADRVEWGRL